MSTLKELIEKHGMGSGQRFLLLREDAPKASWGWIAPFAFSKDEKTVVAHLNDGGLDTFFTNYEGWQLYEEPKKQVVRWKWAYRFLEENYWQENDVFLSDKELEEKKKINVIYKKLTYTETSFEE